MTSVALKALLIASLGGNAALAFTLWRPLPRDAVKASPAALAIVSHSEPASGLSAQAAVSAPVASDADRALILEAAARYGRTPALGDPRALAERMYREGYPPAVVIQVVTPVLSEWMGTEALSKAGREGSVAARELSHSIHKGGGPLQRYMQDLFPMIRETLGDKARERDLRFGALPPEKILAIERLEEELKWGINNGLPSPWDGPTTETKINEALTRFLSPAELADYWRFNSTVARHLQNLIRSITIDEATYDRLLAAATAHHQAAGGREVLDLHHLRGHLSDAGIAQLISTSGRNDEAPVDRIYVSAGLSDAQRVELHAAAKVADGMLPARPGEAAHAALARIRAALAATPEAATRFETTELARRLKQVADRN